MVSASAGEAETLLGIPATRLHGTDIRSLLTDPHVWQALTTASAATPRCVRTKLNSTDSAESIAVRLDLLDLDGGPGAGYLLRLLPAGVADKLEDDDALLRAMFTQSGLGLVIHDSDLRLTRMNPLPRDLAAGPPHGGRAFDAQGARLSELLVPEDAGPLEARLRLVADTGEPLIDDVRSARLAHLPDRERTVRVTALRMQAADGTLRGVAVTYTDVTEEERSRWRSTLLAGAASRLGRSLDIGNNAQLLAELLVPDFADLAAVDLTESVLGGTEPSDFLTGAPLRRLAVAAADGEWPCELYPPGATIRIRDTESEHLRRGAAVFAVDLRDMRSRLAGDAERSRLVLAPGSASFMVLPLHARGHVLGAVALWRTAERAPFTRDDALLAEDIGSRAALAIDNARRYLRERRMAETLQRSLLPRPVMEVTAAETAGIYAALGTGGAPFEPVELELAADDVFAFTAGALADRTTSESDPLLGHLRETTQSGARNGRPLTELGWGILAPLLADPPEDDSTLLLARLRVVAEESVASWEFPADPSIVSESRAAVSRQLARWDLDHLAFSTELIVSELVTNAIRYAGAPVGLRLIKDSRLICEVSDPSQTQPHLRRAQLTDEGGRGLFLVAQVTHRWGSRYTGTGKTIWTEQLLEGVELDFGNLDLDVDLA